MFECLLALLITIGVLFGQFQEKLFAKTMEIEGVPLPAGFTCSESCAVDFWMSFFKFSVFVITLPLHFVPVAGTIFFCYLNGLLLTWGLWAPYFHAFRIGWQTQWSSYVSPHKSDYYSFGFMAMLLNLIPVFNFLFIFTNHIGVCACKSARWR